VSAAHDAAVIIRVLLVDDHQLLAQSLAVDLRAEGLEAHRADLADRDRLVEQVREDPPDLVLLDLDLGGVMGDGAMLVRPFRQAGCRVLIVTASSKREWLGSAIEQGAIGIVAKSSPFDRLLSTVIAAARGEDVMTPDERHQILTELRMSRERQRSLREPFERLTDREQQVLHELSNGKTVCHIAQEWFVSEATVRSQVRGVLTKLGVSSQLEAVAHAMRAGWLTAAS
jgi:DNA-binding NarL/FixJ family response regulator